MSQQIPDLNPFATWSDGQLTSWHRAVEELAHDAWAKLDEDDWSTVSEGLEKARLAGKITKDLEEEMEVWPGKAWALAGFKSQPAGGSPDAA